MERINLNIPGEARRELKRAAKRMGRTESEVARMLVLDGLERLSRDEFYEKVAAAQTPELVKRELEILAALERLDGPAR